MPNPRGVTVCPRHDRLVTLILPTQALKMPSTLTAFQPFNSPPWVIYLFFFILFIQYL